MKLPPVVSLLAFLALPALLRAADPVVLRTESAAIPPGVHALRIENAIGNVVVDASADRLGWEWTLRKRGERTDVAESYARECRLEVRESAGVLTLVLVRPDSASARDGERSPLGHLLGWLRRGVHLADEATIYSDLALRVPATVTIDVQNTFGRVHAAGTRGALSVECRNGPVDIFAVAGAVSAKTSFAPLKVENTGAAQLVAQNGAIEARGIAGSLHATTSFGPMAVHEVKGAAFLKNQNGAIDAANIGGDLTANTSFAELRVTQIAGAAELHNQNGRIDVAAVTGALRAATSFAPLRVQRAGAGAELKNQNGAIDVTGVTGDLVAATSFGEMRATDVGGNADLSSRNGRIEAARVTGAVRAATSFAPLRVHEIGGAAQLQGQNGEVIASAVSGDIRARTSFGRMELDGSGRRIEARNQNGSVAIVARSPAVSHIEASASFAPIELRLPDEAKPLIRARTSFGKVRSDFPVLLADTFDDAKFAADATPLKVDLRGQNGDIRIQQFALR